MKQLISCFTNGGFMNSFFKFFLSIVVFSSLARAGSAPSKEMNFVAHVFNADRNPKFNQSTFLIDGKISMQEDCEARYTLSREQRLDGSFRESVFVNLVQ